MIGQWTPGLNTTSVRLPGGGARGATCPAGSVGQSFSPNLLEEGAGTTHFSQGQNRNPQRPQHLGLLSVTPVPARAHVPHTVSADHCHLPCFTGDGTEPKPLAQAHTGRRAPPSAPGSLTLRPEPFPKLQSHLLALTQLWSAGPRPQPRLWMTTVSVSEEGRPGLFDVTLGVHGLPKKQPTPTGQCHHQRGCSVLFLLNHQVWGLSIDRAMLP